MVAALTLVLAACGGGSGGGNAASGDTDPNGAVSVYGTEPQNTLIPSNTAELGGAKIIEPLFAKLINFKNPGAKPYNVMAESVTTTDSKVYDIKIKQGWKFHDGTEVKAHNFVDAWNYGAYAPNGQLNSDFYSQIEGYGQVHPEDKNAKPTTDKMSGLKVLGDYEFQVTLSAPFSVFQIKIGYIAFAPLP
ncbi:MAG TPA: ABC transporter substrate-binding protein, partial [Amycolatopsis sp.]|nr:ABC transporter substrate-binding protein [Amycolatopsis sp.]